MKIFSLGIGRTLLPFLSALFVCPLAPAAVPRLIHYQGSLRVGDVPFQGTGAFRFALVDAAGTTTYWSNDGTGLNGDVPAQSVALPVANGTFTVVLGDVALPNMTALPATVFDNPAVQLRVWFHDGTAHGIQRLTPDRPIVCEGYVLLAESVSNGAIGAAAFASGAVGAAQLAPGSVGAGQIAAGAVQASHFAPGALGAVGLFTSAPANGTATQAQPNTGYVTSGTTQAIVTLPLSPQVGDLFRISGAGTGGWRAAQNAGQTILTSSLGDREFRTWRPSGPAGNWNAVATSSSGSRLVAVASGSQIQTSADGGVTWVAREAARSWSAVTSASDGVRLTAAVANGSVYTSDDAGATWIARNTIRNWNGLTGTSDGSRLYAITDGSELYVSSNSGISWTVSDGARNWVGVACSADGNRVLAAAPGEALRISQNGGASWTSVESARAWTSVAMTPDASRYFASASGGQIYQSIDFGATWTPLGATLAWRTLACSDDGRTLVAAVDNGQIHTSFDGGQTWTVRENARAWRALAVVADGRRVLAAAGGSDRLYLSQPSTSEGTVGSVSGGPGAVLALQYIGTGQWLPLAQSTVALTFN